MPMPSADPHLQRELQQTDTLKHNNLIHSSQAVKLDSDPV